MIRNDSVPKRPERKTPKRSPTPRSKDKIRELRRDREKRIEEAK